MNDTGPIQLVEGTEHFEAIEEELKYGMGRAERRAVECGVDGQLRASRALHRKSDLLLDLLQAIRPGGRGLFCQPPAKPEPENP